MVPLAGNGAPLVEVSVAKLLEPAPGGGFDLVELLRRNAQISTDLFGRLPFPVKASQRLPIAQADLIQDLLSGPLLLGDNAPRPEGV